MMRVAAALAGTLALAGCVAEAPYPRPYGAPGYRAPTYGAPAYGAPVYEAPVSPQSSLPSGALPSGALPIAPQPGPADLPPPADAAAPGTDSLRDSPMPDSALRDSPLPDGPVLDGPRPDAPPQPPAAEPARPTGDPVTDLLLTPLPQRDATPAPAAPEPAPASPTASPAPPRTEPAQSPFMGFRPMRGQTKPAP